MAMAYGALPLLPQAAAITNAPAWASLTVMTLMRALLDETQSNITRAAEIADVNRRSLQRMLSRLGLRDPNRGGSDRDAGQRRASRISTEIGPSSAAPGGSAPGPTE